MLFIATVRVEIVDIKPFRGHGIAKARSACISEAKQRTFVDVIRGVATHWLRFVDAGVALDTLLLPEYF